ncbi:hypothetical protein B0H16DRAFT_324412 [Mycena metata]|uniref:Fungal N-terminal domain-containing protein n=1 Tax=Mycena metata TaxID=1033252 RepID=A0AAD7MNP8_9AGAR|nr:hypothetical protein B0H16DRAFT_324412 [Mycena metata]
MPFARIFHSLAPNRDADWLSPLIVVSKGLVSVANCVPFPYVSSALGSGVALLELIQAVGKSSEDLKYLAESVVTIMKLLRDEMDSHPNTERANFRQFCLEFEAQLSQLSKDLESMSKNWSSSKFRKYLNSQNVRDRIAQLTRQVDDLRANTTLIAATGTRMDVADGFAAVERRISDLHREIVGNPSTSEMRSTESLRRELARYEEDFHALKLGDIQIEFQTAKPASFVQYDSHGLERPRIAWTDHKATVRGSIHTIRVYEGSDPTESWKGFLSFLVDNSPSPHLPQVFGFCSSPRLRSLVFHGDLLPLDEYAKTLKTAGAIVNWELKLLSDYQRLIATQCQRAWPFYLNLEFTLVNPRDRGAMVISHVTYPSEGWGVWSFRPPFLNWFVQQEGEWDESTLALKPNEKYENRMKDLLYSLLRLRRESFHHPLAFRRGLFEVLTARGSVYDQSSSSVAHLPSREIAPNEMWDIVRTSLGTRFPTRSRTASPISSYRYLFNPTNGCRSSTGNANAAISSLPRINLGVLVPDVSEAWLAQASSITAKLALGECNGSAFSVPTHTALQLVWEMVLTDDNPSVLAKLPEKIHVFIRPPVLSDRGIEEPEIFWSTDADNLEKKTPPSALTIRMRWGTRMSTIY